jgi:hypothetical protein
MKMIMPVSYEDQLDLYVTCTLRYGLKYDFAVPRSSTSYTAYLLNNLNSWIYSRVPWHRWKESHLVFALAKLLLILKKYILYYPHQWEKTANDYRQLLTVTEPLTDKDKELCDLFIRYNEKLYGQRSPDTTEFVRTSRNSAQNIVIGRDEFFQYKKDQQILCIYQELGKRLLIMIFLLD